MGDYLQWVIGNICNNFPYVVMLSSAYDILDSLLDRSGDEEVGYSVLTSS